MDIIGIVCEYNPFHNGHIYHIEKIKELYPNSIIILVLNGYFLERGEISILTKEAKTRIALESGIDIVLELPFIFGCQSGDTFADASIKILNNFGVEKIVFGSETDDINTLLKIANIELNDKEYDKKVKDYLNNGLNYPTALAKALDIKDFNFSSNDLLGISYVKAILKNKYNITPVTIKRTNAYKDIISNDTIISASNIREKINNNIDITKYVPNNTLKNIINVNYDKYFELLKYKILTDNDLEKYLDVTEGVHNRLIKYVSISSNIDELIEKIKTKRYTYNKLNRMFIHILLGLEKSNAHPELDYIKILGFNKNGKQYLNKIKDNLVIPTKINKDSIIYKYELKAAMIYDLINNTKEKEFELKKEPIIIK